MDTISVAELKKKLDDFELMALLDVRPAEEYQKSHIASSISLPLSEKMQQEAKVFLKKEDDIIIYGSSGVEEAASRLKKNGYPKLRILAGGITAWLSEGGTVTNKVSMG